MKKRGTVKTPGNLEAGFQAYEKSGWRQLNGGAPVLCFAGWARRSFWRPLPRRLERSATCLGRDQKRYAVDSAAAFLRDELQKTENIVKIKEVIVEDSREDDIEDNFTVITLAAGRTWTMRHRGRSFMRRMRVRRARWVRSSIH